MDKLHVIVRNLMGREDTPSGRFGARFQAETVSRRSRCHLGPWFWQKRLRRLWLAGLKFFGASRHGRCPMSALQKYFVRSSQGRRRRSDCLSRVTGFYHPGGFKPEIPPRTAAECFSARMRAFRWQDRLSLPAQAIYIDFNKSYLLLEFAYFFAITSIALIIFVV